MIRLKVTTTAVLSENIAKIHRVLQKILSDRKLQFTSKFMKDLTKALETKQILYIAYYLQMNGQMERINQKVEAFLQQYMNYQQDD